MGCVKFLLKLYEKGDTTRSQIQQIVETSEGLLHMTTASICRNVKDLVKELGMNHVEKVTTLNNTLQSTTMTFECLETDFKRIVEFKKRGLIMPQLVIERILQNIALKSKLYATPSMCTLFKPFPN
ncbi:hypothetical protein EB796_018869 [Bugula neritina]|uniref:Uncharacterized protein n=1 Tax=Bugula neritina TaxID=10212 RepID=A0A7J7J9X7_BUGNE|nr:hypothetical protein EB796_018869 [Bugula neritina]